jgi:hypothetical protein
VVLVALALGSGQCCVRRAPHEGRGGQAAVPPRHGFCPLLQLLTCAQPRRLGSGYIAASAPCLLTISEQMVEHLLIVICEVEMRHMLLAMSLDHVMAMVFDALFDVWSGAGEGTC